MKTIAIAIDGPGGAGKSTIARRLAAELGYVYLDTGAMYRAIALKADGAGLQPVESEALTAMLADTDVSVEYDGGVMRIYTDGADVSERIREHRVSRLASDFSALKSVRLTLVALQRKLAAEKNTILDGRDIGTFVLPDADFKFYLTASAEVRAMRRCLELKSRGEDCEYGRVLQDIVERDYNDSHREFAPLKKAPDAVEIDSTRMTIDEVVAAMLKIIREGR